MSSRSLWRHCNVTVVMEDKSRSHTPIHYDASNKMWFCKSMRNWFEIWDFKQTLIWGVIISTTSVYNQQWCWCLYFPQAFFMKYVAAESIYFTSSRICPHRGECVSPSKSWGTHAASGIIYAHDIHLLCFDLDIVSCFMASCVVVLDNMTVTQRSD